jgi:tetratricopeptide (TPR) repeat protein
MTPHADKRRWRAALVVPVSLALALTCVRCSKTSPPAQSQAPAESASKAPPSVILPDLGAMAPPVREQIQAQYERLVQANAHAAPTVERAAAYGQLGKLFLAADIAADAESCFLNAHALAPDDVRWAYYLAHTYRVQGESRQAATFFELTLKSRPDDVAALVWLGEMYLDQGRLDESAPLFMKALTQQPRAVAARFGLGRVALAKHDYARAVDELESALALDRRATIVHYPLATAYRALGRIDQAEAHLRQRGTTEIGPPDPLMQELGELLHSSVVYENRGDRAIAGGDFAAAAVDFRRGLELAPESLPLRQKLATALSLTGDIPGAVRQFQDLLRRAPESPGAHYSLGVLLLADGQYDQAIERFAAAVRYDPTYLQARLQLANVLRLRGRYESSDREYLEVIKMDPRVGEARFGEAVALVGLKRYVQARERLVEMMRLYPDRPEPIDALARLYATAPDDRVRDGKSARGLAESLLKRLDTPDAREVMAMALAEVGDYEAAVRWQREAIATAERAGGRDRAALMTENLDLYRTRRPCRVPWRDNPRWN